MNSERTRRSGAEDGFSLIELVVAIALFTIVMGAVYGLLAVGTSCRICAHRDCRQRREPSVIET